MKCKLSMIFSTLILFTGCEMVPSLKISQTTAGVLKSRPICVWKNTPKLNDCNVEYWLKFWNETEGVSWPKRKIKIAALSEEDVDVLKKVLLSQGKNTPFQDRLRAQGWLKLILQKLSQPMRRFVLVSLYHPSQDLLELESALVTLSKINTHQFFTIEEQKIRLNKQQSQIEQLLNIEASIMQSTEEGRE